jgi:hypothetical protein
MNKNDQFHFVCRKCRLEWKLECITMPNNDLIFKMKQEAKGEE